MKSYLVFMTVLLITAIVTVSSAMISTLPATPAPGGDQGYFSINSVPSGGDVYFDSAFWGETPVVVTVSTTGNPTHSIRITLAGYEE